MAPKKKLNQKKRGSHESKEKEKKKKDDQKLKRFREEAVDAAENGKKRAALAAIDKVKPQLQHRALFFRLSAEVYYVLSKNQEEELTESWRLVRLAEEYSRTAAEMEATAIEFQGFLSAVLMVVAQYDEALAVSERALELTNPDDPLDSLLINPDAVSARSTYASRVCEIKGRLNAVRDRATLRLKEEITDKVKNLIGDDADNAKLCLTAKEIEDLVAYRVRRARTARQNNEGSSTIHLPEDEELKFLKCLGWNPTEPDDK